MPSSLGSPFAPASGGVKLALRLTPKAAHDRIDGIVAEADGKLLLKAAVTAVPEDGKANAALIRMLAKEWHLAKSSITVTSGATDRRKTLLIEGDPAELMKFFENWIRTHG